MHEQRELIRLSDYVEDASRGPGYWKCLCIQSEALASPLELVDKPDYARVVVGVDADGNEYNGKEFRLLVSKDPTDLVVLTRDCILLRMEINDTYFFSWRHLESVREKMGLYLSLELAPLISVSFHSFDVVIRNPLLKKRRIA